MYIFKYTYMCIYVHIYVQIYMYMFIHTYLYVYVLIDKNMFIHTNLYVYVHTDICIYIFGPYQEVTHLFYNIDSRTAPTYATRISPMRTVPRRSSATPSRSAAQVLGSMLWIIN
jgi:hypothetical protein